MKRRSKNLGQDKTLDGFKDSNVYGRGGGGLGGVADERQPEEHYLLNLNF